MRPADSDPSAADARLAWIYFEAVSTGHPARWTRATVRFFADLYHTLTQACLRPGCQRHCNRCAHGCGRGHTDPSHNSLLILCAHAHDLKLLLWVWTASMPIKGLVRNLLRMCCHKQLQPECPPIYLTTNEFMVHGRYRYSQMKFASLCRCRARAHCGIVGQAIRRPILN
jgi:hypothetical protein